MSDHVYPDDFEVKHDFEVVPDLEQGGYTILFPLLPGCMTQIETLDELPHMARDCYYSWITCCDEEGISYPDFDLDQHMKDNPRWTKTNITNL